MLDKISFEWDGEKDRENQIKHHVSLREAQYAFGDPKRVIVKDVTHSTDKEERLYCIGRISNGIVTVRFIYRKKITISLTKRSIEFFKKEARRHSIQYQKMIRILLDEYANRNTSKT